MGLISEVALFFLVLIGIYAGLHDFLGLNIIPYDIFNTFLAPAFVAFLFIVISSVAYWLYRIQNQPLKKNAVKLLKASIIVLAFGVFFTSTPPEALTTLKLLIGKLFLIGGLALGVVTVQVNNRLVNPANLEQNRNQNRL